MGGLISYGAYLPSVRLDRAEIGAAFGGGGGKGTRAVASFDEDTTSMGVAAARNALAGVGDRKSIGQLLFATAMPAYLDKANATAISAACGLDEATLAFDMIGSVRSGLGALVMASQASVPTLAVLSDLRGGLPAGADERDGGDGAAAFVFADGSTDPVLATIRANVSVTEEFLERWRPPNSANSKVWEERFGAEVYGPLVKRAFAAAFEKAGVSAEKIDHLIVAGLHGRAVKEAIKSAGVKPEAVVADRTGTIGNAGLAQPGLLLADVLDRAAPGQTILLMVLSDGVSALVLETTDAIANYEAPHSVASQASGTQTVRYTTFLDWRGTMEREAQRRARPVPPSAPPSYRRRGWKFGLVGGECNACGKRQMHPGRVCIGCGEVDRIEPASMADLVGTIVTMTVDNLAYSPSPPLIMVMVEFEGGGRLRCQLTDADPKWDGVGQRVEMTFRRFYTADGIHNYFWKARPLRKAGQAGEAA